MSVPVGSSVLQGREAKHWENREYLTPKDIFSEKTEI